MNKKRDQKQIHQNKPIGQILLRVGNHPSPLLLRTWIQDYSVVQRQLIKEIDFFISFEKRFITLKRGLKDLLTSCYLLASEYYLLSPRLWRRTRERPRGKWVIHDNCKGNKLNHFPLFNPCRFVCARVLTRFHQPRAQNRLSSKESWAGDLFIPGRGGVGDPGYIAKKNQNTEVYCGIHESVEKKHGGPNFSLSQ